jgi:sigma-E factor negative regulatory protein RseC
MKKTTDTGYPMIDAPGTIIELDGEYAMVRMDETGCGRCHEAGGCGGNNIGKMFCNAPRVFRVLNPEQTAVGTQVMIAIAEGAVRRSAVLAYGLPLLALFLGAFCGSAVAGESGSIIGAICGLLVAWMGLRFAHGLRSPGRQFQPYIQN